MADDLTTLYTRIYQQGDLGGIDRPLAIDPVRAPAADARPHSIAIGGGAFGDEGKGRVVDAMGAAFMAAHGTLVVYRWNGGANAGHTVVVGDTKIALHQLPSGVLFAGAHIVLGKGMVIHPGDLLAEIDMVAAVAGSLPAALHVDPVAVLALDTHRALEGALKRWMSGGAGATGRGISPAYADVLYRHPARVRDLLAGDWQERLGAHYDLYAALVGGLGADLATQQVTTLAGEPITVGTRRAFLDRLGGQRARLLPVVDDVHTLLRGWWADASVPFIFEGAQGAGLDPRWGVYPDVTASDPTFGGILHSTEGLIAPGEIAVRAAVLKTTYTSSVGARRLPTAMAPELAHRIREDAGEYGATTRRPRDIAYLDLPCLRFLSRVSSPTHLALTHLDIAYPDVPVRVCTHYTDAAGDPVPYRPDQVYLDTVTPHYLDLPGWDGAASAGAREIRQLPQAALQCLAFLTGALAAGPLFGTTGPERDALISWMP